MILEAASTKLKTVKAKAAQDGQFQKLKPYRRKIRLAPIDPWDFTEPIIPHYPQLITCH